jgi:N-acetylglutamate synthase
MRTRLLFDVSALEEKAFAAWPAEEVQEMDGWWLRSTRGVSRRANSVWPSKAGGALALNVRIDAVEAFYRDRNQPAIFQLSPVAAPEGLDQALAGRGYRVDAPTSVQVAQTAAAEQAPPPGVRAVVEPRPSSTWFELSALRWRFAPHAEIHRALLERIGDRAVYALAERESMPGAVGVGVIDGRWMGVFAMFTLPEQRRRGLAAAVLSALAGRARSLGVQHLYLQVEVANSGARALYARAGFRDAYPYHYRVSK